MLMTDAFAMNPSGTSSDSEARAISPKHEITKRAEPKQMGTSLAAPLPTSHPVFGIREVFQMILGYLPPTTLPNCRLVSQQWNSNTAEVMKRKDWTIRIVGTDCILEYVDQVKASDPSESKLNLNVNLGLDPSITQKKLLQGLSAMVNLTSLRGRNYVHSFGFTCATDWKECWNEMFASLHYIAPGLKRLTIGEKLLYEPPSHPDPSALPTEFPQLLEFTYYPQMGETEVLAHIVNGSPNLEELTIICDYVDELSNQINELYYTQLLDLIYSAVSKFTSDFAHLKELNIPLSEPEHYIALQRLHFPVLNKLYLYFMNLFEREEPNELALATFLTQNCPRLVSLHFELNGCFGDAIFPGGLPPLPNLTHFFYYIEHLDFPVFAKSSNLNPASFINLTSVTVYFGQFLYHSQEEEEDDDEFEEQVGHIEVEDEVEHAEVEDEVEHAEVEEEVEQAEVEDEVEQAEVEDEVEQAEVVEEVEHAEVEEEVYIGDWEVDIGDVEAGNDDDLVVEDEEEEEEDNHLHHHNHGRPHDWSKTQITFNQVHKLHLIIDECWEPVYASQLGVYAQVSHYEFSQHLHALFPAVRELIVEVKIEPLRENAPKIQEALQTLLSGKLGCRVKQLEIINYYYDWLAVLLQQSSAVRTSLSGLKSLTIPPLANVCMKSIDSSTIPGAAGKAEHEHSSLTLSVASIMANVPDLEKLKVHDLFLRAKGEAAAAAADRGRDIEEILEEFQLAYPGLTIELL